MVSQHVCNPQLHEADATCMQSEVFVACLGTILKLLLVVSISGTN